MTVSDFLLTMASVLLFCGVVVMGIGILTLIGKLNGKEIRTIADQTTKLAQKGITEEISGLVGNARSLIEALDQMVKTTAGIGVFLVVLGALLLVAAYVLVTRIN
ncbi:MAG TPA: hypothetical protein PKK59_01635 [Anaerolineaceae bacterium]|nr:hypothetical protein [Anaerolineaceae bacterium]